MPRFPWLRKRSPVPPPAPARIALLVNGLVLAGPFTIEDLQLMSKYGHAGGPVDVGWFEPHTRGVHLSLLVSPPAELPR